MKWISKSVLSILLGISLTTFGLSVAVLLYTTFDKDENDKTKKHDQIAKSKPKHVCVEVAFPKKHVSAIIGKGGSVINNIQELTNTRIRLEKEEVYCKDRTCKIWATDMKDILAAQNMISCIVNNRPAIETYELFVPHEAFTGLFKASWDAFFQQIRRANGAKIVVEHDAYKTENGVKKRIILKGTADQIASTLIQIEDKAKQEIKNQAQLKSMLAETAKMMSIQKFKLSSNNTDVKSTTDDNPAIETRVLFVPHTACGRIIGRSGHSVQEMERSSGARIRVESPSDTFDSNESWDNSCSIGNERKVTITGTAEQIKLAITQIEDKVRQGNGFLTKSNCELATTTEEIFKSESVNDGISNALKFSKILMKQDGLMEVYVSAMETPSLFWIQVVGLGNVDLKNLVHEMTEYYDNAENRRCHALKKVTLGQMVAAKFKYDNRWYRAEVIALIGHTECKVFFVDYGDLEIVPMNEVYELRTDMLSLRLQAVECSLANVKPRDSEWSPDANDKFAELAHLAKWKALVAKVKGYKERPVDYKESRRQSSLIPCIDLYDKDGDTDTNIGEALVHLGMAQVEEEVCSAVNSALPSNKRDLPFIPFLPDSFNLD